jgi:hypothetical protein
MKRSRGALEQKIIINYYNSDNKLVRCLGKRQLKKPKSNIETAISKAKMNVIKIKGKTGEALYSNVETAKGNIPIKRPDNLGGPDFTVVERNPLTGKVVKTKLVETKWGPGAKVSPIQQRAKPEVVHLGPNPESALKDFKEKTRTKDKRNRASR